MRYRTLGRLGWQVSEIGYGMWGIGGGPGGFTGWDYDVAPACLDLAVELGCNFFDTAWAYGRGISEQMLGALLRRHPGPQAVRRDEDPAEEPGMAALPGRHPG